MNKKYIVRLSDEERAVCLEIVKRLKGTSEKVKRAQVLLKADADGPGWPDAKIAEAYGCTVRIVEKLRERLVTDGFDVGAVANWWSCFSAQRAIHSPSQGQRPWNRRDQGPPGPTGRQFLLTGRRRFRGNPLSIGKN